MKNVVVATLSVVVLAIGTASTAFGAQASLVSSAVRGLSVSLGRAGLQAPVSGNVLGLAGLPSTSTGGGIDGLALALGSVLAVTGAFILVRKAILDR